MLRLLFVTITMTLLGLGSGYFLWGARVARLTESMNGLTLELDTMRERLAKPQPEQGGTRAADELRVINESIAAFRVEMAEQKATIERNAAAIPADVATVTAELRTVRNELAACIADKQDAEMRCGGAKPAIPGYAPSPPSYVPVPAPSYTPPRQVPQSAPPSPAGRPPGSDLSDPRF